MPETVPASQYWALHAAQMSEAELLNTILEAAQKLDWLIYHAIPATNQAGVTLTWQRGTKGFPDLVLARGGIVHIWELKSEKGRTSPEQNSWLAATGGRVVRPSDLQWVYDTLQGAN